MLGAEMSPVRTLIICQARAQFKRRSTANNVQIIIPVPDDADSPRFRTNVGTVHYTPETSSIVWKIKQFGGAKEFLMRAELGLPSVRGDDDKGGGMMGGFGGSMGGVGAGKGKRPIQVKFEIPYFTTSGIQVRYLKIIEPKVRAFPRCLTNSVLLLSQQSRVMKYMMMQFPMPFLQSPAN
jgi:AP-1 complex subunit mu